MSRQDSSGGHIRNVDQLRDRIDSGATGDKVAVGDPAAAPLGTDDEAGGVPNSHARLKMAASAELHRTQFEGGPRRERKEFPLSWLWIVLVVIVTAAGAAWAMLR